MENRDIADIVLTENEARCEIKMPETYQASIFFAELGKIGVNIDMISQYKVGNYKTFFISVPSKDIKSIDQLKMDNISIEIIDNLSKIIILGRGIKANISILHNILTTLHTNDIYIENLSTSEVKICILLKSELALRAVKLIKDCIK